MTEPQRVPADPRVALVAYAWPSSKVAGVFYDVALLTGEPASGSAWCAVCEGADPWNGELPNGGCVCAPGKPYWHCSCPGYSYRDRCQHVTAAETFFRRERARDERQAELDARLGCRHPLTFDEDEPDFVEQRTHVYRTCMGCGLSVDRAPWQERIEADIRERHRLPATPWSASERASDTE